MKQRGFLLLPVVIMVFLVITLMFVIYTNKQQYFKTENNTPVNTPTSIPFFTEATPDPNIVWTTYTNTVYGFEFQYPNMLQFYCPSRPGLIRCNAERKSDFNIDGNDTYINVSVNDHFLFKINEEEWKSEKVMEQSDSMRCFSKDNSTDTKFVFCRIRRTNPETQVNISVQPITSEQVAIINRILSTFKFIK